MPKPRPYVIQWTGTLYWSESLQDWTGNLSKVTIFEDEDGRGPDIRASRPHETIPAAGRVNTKTIKPALAAAWKAEQEAANA